MFFYTFNTFGIDFKLLQRIGAYATTKRHKNKFQVSLQLALDLGRKEKFRRERKTQLIFGEKIGFGKFLRISGRGSGIVD